MIEEKHYKYLKLTNGEDIIVSTDNNCSNFKDQKYLYVYDPVLINTIKIARGPYMVESFTMQPWIKLAKSDIVEIPTESIVVVVDIEDKVVTEYHNYLTEYKQHQAEGSSGITDDDMAEIFDELEAEEDDDGTRCSSRDEEGPTFH
jgi:hypothetical protein